MHYTRNTSSREMVIVNLNEIGFGRKLFFTYSTFTFKQGQNTKIDQIKHFQSILLNIYNEFKLNVIYSMLSGEGLN